MEKILPALVALALIFSAEVQASERNSLQNPANGLSLVQTVKTTATLKSASRLFAAKDDLTTVIMILPSGSAVNILESDSTYYKVSFEENEGYILKKHAVIDNNKQAGANNNQYQQTQQQVQQKTEPQQSRFTYLENKYGTNMAARLNSGKIWKGMNSDMVNDSWGTALKVNRVISGNIIKEEWIYKNTWLYFENSILLEWGPIRE